MSVRVRLSISLAWNKYKVSINIWMDEQDISFNYIVLYYLGVNEPTYGNGVSLDVLEKGAEKGADVRKLAKGGPSGMPA